MFSTKTTLMGQLKETTDALGAKTAEAEELSGTLVKKEEDIKSRDAIIGSLKMEIEQLRGEIKGLHEEFELKVADFDKQIEDQATDLATRRMAQLGVEPVEVDPKSQDFGDAGQHFMTLKGAEATAFYKQHRSEILKTVQN
jgi:chromosome segregation ATPase